ncbi:MAG: galactose oxidase-like domain-containing protein, partial [Acidimicrobiales bacterium]
TWTALTGISTPQVHERLYPLSFLLPNGKVLVIAPQTGATYVLDVDNQTWTSVGTAPLRNGSAAMYQPGKILFSGGGDVSSATNPAQRTAAILDLTAPSPSWQLVASMASARFLHPSVVLPNGHVLMVGGAGTMGLTSDAFVVTSELWDPASSTWTTVPAMDSGRGYHATALLMPDARVLVAGSGRIGAPAPDNFTAQMYSPPYLFKGSRPTITSAPASADYGSTFTVQTPNAAHISSVALVRLGADTHTLDMDQRVVALSFTAGPGTLAVQVPTSSAQAPPGSYMLFILNGKGVPSVAKFIQIGSAGGLANQPAVDAEPTEVATADQQSVPVIVRPSKSPRPVDPRYGREAFPSTAAGKASDPRAGLRETSDHVLLCRL